MGLATGGRAGNALAIRGGELRARPLYLVAAADHPPNRLRNVAEFGQAPDGSCKIPAESALSAAENDRGRRVIP